VRLTIERPWFPYPRGDFPADGACWLRLYQAPDHSPVLVFTELNGNPGASVEHAIEELAATAWQALLPDQADPPLFVTHFQRGRYGGHSDEPATFTLAHFTRIDPHRMRLGGVRWQPLTVQDLAVLVGRRHAEALAAWQEPLDRPATREPSVGHLDDAWMAAYLAHLEGVIAEDGWAIHTVLPPADDPDPQPPFAYTVGLSGPRFGHPELLLVGLGRDTAGIVLTDLCERVRDGQRLYAGQRIGDLLRDVDGGAAPVELVRVDDAADVRAPLSAANRLYGHGGSVEALQVVWPDHQHQFPWDPGCDGAMRALQPLLGRRATPTGPPS
jgi:Domain of unknown function (DUF4262)